MGNFLWIWRKNGQNWLEIINSDETYSPLKMGNSKKLGFLIPILSFLWKITCTIFPRIVVHAPTIFFTSKILGSFVYKCMPLKRSEISLPIWFWYNLYIKVTNFEPKTWVFSACSTTRFFYKKVFYKKVLLDWPKP